MVRIDKTGESSRVKRMEKRVNIESTDIEIDRTRIRFDVSSKKEESKEPGISDTKARETISSVGQEERRRNRDEVVKLLRSGEMKVSVSGE
jgi:hypothetical protein